MACRYTYKGKTYEAHEFDDALRAMSPAEAAPFMLGVSALPDAPFVNRTDAWVSLALRRIAKMAVDEGYDKVAFVNGEQSAERYDLSKQVASIDYADYQNGNYRLTVKGINGEKIINEELMDAEKIEATVGKDLAQKIVNGEGTAQKGPWRRISGDGLKVGGEGMKAFYDKIVPSVAKDVVRKLGGGALETVSIPGSGESRDDLAAKVYGSGETYRNLPSEMKRKIDSMLEKRMVDQPGFDITPAMRERAAEGVPLFDRKVPTDQPKGIPAQKLRLMLAPAANKLHISVKVVDTPADLPTKGMPADVRGFYDGDTGAIYVVASNITSREDALRAVGHEAVAHLGLRHLLDAEDWSAMMAQIPTSENAAIRGLRDQVRATYVDERGQFNLSPEEEGDEIAALAVERGVDGNGDFRPGFEWLKEIFAKVVAWLRSKGLDINFTNSELQAALVRARKVLEAGPEAAAAKGGSRMARGADQTQTEAFKTWFGNSKVVDAQGKPLVVYHGRHGDYSTFKGSRAYFTADASYASRYAGVDEDTTSDFPPEGGNVMPVYLSLQNPLDFRSLGDGDIDTETLVQFLQDHGVRNVALIHALRDSYRNGTPPVWQLMHKGEFRDAIKAAGFDSVIQKESIGKNLKTEAYITFDPAQIKSATGNRGTFDGRNPDIRLARTYTLREATDALKTATQPLGSVSLWDRTVGTQYHKATKDADFKRVFDGFVQQTDDTAHYAIEAESKAPSILMRIDSVRDALKAVVKSGKQQKEDLGVVSKALFANIEGEEGVKSTRYDDDSLRIIFNMTPRQIEMYHQARAAVDTSVERLAQTYAAQMGAEQGMHIEQVKDMDLADTVATVKQFIQAKHDELRATAALAKDVQAEEGDDVVKPPRAPSLRETARQLDRLGAMEEQTKFLQEAGYMPAMRFGRFAVTVKGEDGEVEHFEMFETRWEANIAAAKLQRQYPASSVEKGVMNPEQYAMFKGVSPETVALFAKFTGADQTEAYQDYIALAKSARNVMHRQLKRKGVAGFSEDATRVLAAFVTSNARQSAINMNAGEIGDALASKDLARKGDVQREAQKLSDYMSDPIEEARRLRGFMFMHFMGGSVASALVNLTQPVLQTGPYLHQFVGNKAAGILATSARMAATGNIADPELARAAKRAREDGITEPHEIHQLMADAGSSAFGNSLRWRAAVKLWASFFSTSEAFNRRVTFLAAYQTWGDMSEEQRRKNGADGPYDFARRAVVETQGLYSKANRPNWARGAVGATIFTFKQFSIAYLEWLSRLPTKQKVIALAILLLAAGTEGLPFADDLEDLIDTVGQSLGYNTNSKKAKRKLLEETFGQNLGEILNTGLASKSGVDVAGRLGMGNLLPATAAFKPSETDKAKTIGELAGPIAGILQQFQRALAKAQRGEVLGRTGAFSEMAPTAVRNAMQGADMAATGVYKDTRGYKVADVDAWESFAKMLGLQPSSIATQSRKFSDELQDKQLTTAVEGAIADRWAAGVADKNPEAVQAAREALRTWNEKNPESRIVIKPQQISSRVKKMRETRDQRFLKTVPKENRTAAARELS